MLRTNVWTPRGESGGVGGGSGGMHWEIGIDMYTLMCIKWMTNKNLLYSTGNSTQYSVMAYMGKESKKEWIYLYV